ncbi:hypothetical protein TgHK011_005440 [Trichoderma gracile]|nr:hypothetical protein TgHK011_005440 [Trichoderma gracile]
MSGDGLASVSPTLCCCAKLRRGPDEIRARGHSRFRSKQRARFDRGGERCDRSNKRCCRGSALSVTTEPQTACCAEEGVSAAARNLDGARLFASPSSKPPGPSSSVLFVDISAPGKGLRKCRQAESSSRLFLVSRNCFVKDRLVLVSPPPPPAAVPGHRLPSLLLRVPSVLWHGRETKHLETSLGCSQRAIAIGARYNCPLLIYAGRQLRVWGHIAHLCEGPNSVLINQMPYIEQYCIDWTTLIANAVERWHNCARGLLGCNGRHDSSGTSHHPVRADSGLLVAHGRGDTAASWTFGQTDARFDDFSHALWDIAKIAAGAIPTGDCLASLGHGLPLAGTCWPVQITTTYLQLLQHAANIGSSFRIKTSQRRVPSPCLAFPVAAQIRDNESILIPSCRNLTPVILAGNGTSHYDSFEGSDPACSIRQLALSFMDGI